MNRNDMLCYTETFDRHQKEYDTRPYYYIDGKKKVHSVHCVEWYNYHFHTSDHIMQLDGVKIKCGNIFVHKSIKMTNKAIINLIQDGKLSLDKIRIKDGLLSHADITEGE